MDSLRGQFPDQDEPDTGPVTGDDATGAAARTLTGGDERRMQVRAYNFWAALLANRTFPDIADLHPERLQDFGPYSVLLDFTQGFDDPAIAYLGAQLAEECGTTGPIGRLSEVPARSLLSRITDHYLQIIANEAPIGFEAEFINQRGATILYRGILLPFSRDDRAIDYIYGVINWKELTDQEAADRLTRQVDEAVDARPALLRDPFDAPLTEWADGPADFGGTFIETADGPGFADDLPTPAFDLPIRARIERDLRALPSRPLSSLVGEGQEFTVLVARRLDNGEVVLLGEIADDADLLNRAARHLLG